MKRIFVALLLLPLCSGAQIRVSDNSRQLVTADGKPFFWLGDTAWELFHRLTREEAEEFLTVRQQQGFNVIQAVALAELNGLRQPNRYGDWPLNNEDPTQLLVTPGNNPNDAYEYDYWDHVDYIIQSAGKKGMYVGLLPTWGDKLAHMWGDGPIVFNEKNAEAYGAMLARRYQNQWNVLWILGGDRPAVYSWKTNDVDQKFDDRAMWRAMARGIESVLTKDAFITYHPAGGSYSTSQFIANEPWLDMHAFQSGHGSREADAWNWVVRDLAVKPIKPTLDMEPCYEDHPVNPWDGKWTRQRGYFNAYDVRARVYRGVFAGACGVTYGHHQIWQFLNVDLYPPVNVGDTLIGWQRAARANGAAQMQYLKQLMLSRPYLDRLPDQSLIRSEKGTTYADLAYATRAADRSFALIYLPQNKPVRIEVSAVTGRQKKAWWFDPRSGKSEAIKNVKTSGIQLFTPPKEGQDWVLVIDDASQNFSPPAE